MHKGDVFTAATRRSDRAATPIKNPANYWIGSVGVSRRCAGAHIRTSTNAGGVLHGFVRAKDGTITTFDAPGSTGTFELAINPGGVITGAFSDASGATHGFVRIP